MDARLQTWVIFLFCVVATACGAIEPDPAIAAMKFSSAAASIFEPELGKGVNAAETQTFAKCVVFPGIDTQPLGFQSRLYDEYNVQSRQELDRKLDVSASVNAKGLWGSAGGEAHYFKNLEFREDAFYWVVDARYSLQHESFDTSSQGFGLSELAKRLLKERGIVGFTKACGTRFYVGRTLGARYNLVYEFRSSEDKFVQKLKLAAHASAFGVDGEAELNKFISVAKKSAYVKVHSGIEGGGASVGDYANDAASLKAELARLRDDLLTRRQGRVLGWEVMSYDIFPEVQAAKDGHPDPEADDLYKREALAFYYVRFVQNQARIAHLTILLDRAGGAEPYYVYSATSRAAIAASINTLAVQNDTIAQRAERCLATSEPCPTANLPPVSDLEPRPDKDFSDLGTWSMYPILRHNSVAMLDFYGNPGGDYKGRIFDTNEDLFSSPVGAFVMAQDATGRRYPRLVGSLDPLTTPQGTTRPKICLDSLADSCNFRAVEDATYTMDDGYPVTRLLLTIFDANGIQTDKFVFRVRS